MHGYPRKKQQLQLENQASLFKLTQADLTNSITPAIDQITNTVKEVQVMVKSVVDLSKATLPIHQWKKQNQLLSEGEEEDEPPRKKQNPETIGKSMLNQSTLMKRLKKPYKKKAAPQQRKKGPQIMEEGSEEGEIKKPSQRKSAQLKQNDSYEDSEFEENNPLCILT